MKHTLFGIDNLDVYLVLGVLVFFGLVETISGQLRRSKRSPSDWIQEVGSFLVLSTVIKPLIVISVLLIGNTFFSASANILSEYTLFLVLIPYLLMDDLLQYWYHRSAHEYPFLWKLHRAHHQAEEMGFFVSYRNAGLYYLLMPNIWWIGWITFLGGGKAVALGLVLKQAIIISSHSTIKWDKPFYNSKWLKPIIQIIERIIVTPAFHHAHHGKSKIDAVSDPNSNFGNMFSIWDQLFGTAVYSHQFPSEYGLQRASNDHWSAAYLYPLITSKDERSELAKGFAHQKTVRNEPIMVELEKGENYLYCRCGCSQTQPFCDGSHHGTKHTPMLFEAKRTGPAKLCNCKKTKTGPFCDHSHLGIKS